jgi:hypothetical protein
MRIALSLRARIPEGGPSLPPILPVGWTAVSAMNHPQGRGRFGPGNSIIRYNHTMNDTEPKLQFTPVHPLNFPYREILEESEHPSGRWPHVKRAVSLFIDLEGQSAVMVAFKLADAPGNIDFTRCYTAHLAAQGDYKNPLATLPDRLAVADQCEAQFAAKLAQFYGEPGRERPAHWRAS